MQTWILLPNWVVLYTCLTSIEVLEVPIKWNNERTPPHPDCDGSSRTSVDIEAVIPLLGNATFIAGNIIILHSRSVKLQAGIGCFSFAEILECRDV